MSDLGKIAVLELALKRAEEERDEANNRAHYQMTQRREAYATIARLRKTLELIAAEPKPLGGWAYDLVRKTLAEDPK